mgnify:FL=1|jgi:hypothetical protein
MKFDLEMGESCVLKNIKSQELAEAIFYSTICGGNEDAFWEMLTEMANCIVDRYSPDGEEACDKALERAKALFETE